MNLLALIAILGMYFSVGFFANLWTNKRIWFFIGLSVYILFFLIRFFTGIVSYSSELAVVNYPLMWNRLTRDIWGGDIPQDFLRTYYIVNAHYDYQAGQYIILGTLGKTGKFLYNGLILLWHGITFVIFPLFNLWQYIKRVDTKREGEK